MPAGSPVDGSFAVFVISSRGKALHAIMMNQQNVTCVIVNWNGWRDTISCLNALARSTHKALSIIVVDNGSTDESIQQIRAHSQSIVLLESGRNLGFAGGNNIGIRHALAHGADYVWLLNNDTEPAPQALSALINKALTSQKIGAVASICYYATSPLKVQAWAGAKVNLWVGYGRNTVAPQPDTWFDALYGASMLIARPSLEDVGLLDEGFFHYWEETEFCLRLRKRGWRLAAAPASRVLHKVGASTGGNSVILDRYFTSSGLRILKLHSPAPALAMFLFVSVRLLRRALRLQFLLCSSVWAGVRDYRAVSPH